ncbi:hypothetical protein SO802_009116 [Lithocarpus litseifolius]|uniref:RNase H type-1 domain-containing protein n=1 Tax=Lithocarpus litseifolius TaxID=425828 RepID=A0AAW2DDB7_9ROSI
MEGVDVDDRKKRLKEMEEEMAALCEMQAKVESHIRHRQVVQKWSPPIQDTVKTNFDGAWFTESDDAGIGVVIRNSEGEVMATMSEKILKPPSIEILELLAARCAVVFIVETRFHQAVIDAESVVMSLQSGGMEFARGRHIIKDILY